MKTEKRTKRFGRLTMLLVLLTVLMLSACTGGAAKTTAPAETSGSTAEGTAAAGTAAPEVKKIRVAMVLPGTINDEGWNAMAYSGLQTIANLGYETKYSENVKTSDFESVFRGYANQGYELIIGHGFDFFETAKQIAADYPDTWFAITSTDQFVPPNVCSIDTNSMHAGFMSGVLAAKMTKTNVVACVAGMEMPGITRYVVGFEQGAKYVNPDIVVKSTYTGSNQDTDAMKQVTKAMIESGADIIAPNGNQAAIGAFEMVRDAKDVYIIGVYSDQSTLAPEKTLSSSMLSFPDAIVEVAKICGEGKLEAKSYAFGAEQGFVKMAPYLDVVPEDVRQYVADTLEKLSKGEIKVVFEEK